LDFIAVVLIAGYGGYGPSLLALGLLWLSAEVLVPVSGASRDLFESRSQIALAFVFVGVPITLLGGALRAARDRAASSSADFRRALCAQQGEREWLQITLSSIADAVITTDPNGLVVFLNPVAAQLTGWSLTEAVGRPLNEVFRTAEETPLSPGDLPVAKVLAGGDAIMSNNEVMLSARDGAARCIERDAAPIKDSDGRVKGAAVVFRDITERRCVELAHRESEERFRQLAERITDVFWIHDPDGPRTAYVSPAYESIWGRSCASLYERPMSYLEAIHSDDRDRARRAHDRIVSGCPTAEEYRIIRPDGSVRWIWDRGFPVKDESGRVVRLAGIAEDITERKQAEEKLRNADRRKEEFLAVLSHELRNPLAPIQTALDLLEQCGTGTDRSRQELATITRQVRNLERLVDDLLDVSRISRGRSSYANSSFRWRRSSRIRLRQSARWSMSNISNSTYRS
jgi:PAS domain S-box-containing protein